MKLNLPLVSGIFLAAISLYFSATGLVHLFAGAGTGILLMAIAFELAKITGVTWLIQNGKRNLLSLGISLALICLIAISSLGIYGYLGRAFNQSRSSSVVSSTQTASLSRSVGMLTSDRSRLLALVESVPNTSPSAKRRMLNSIQPELAKLNGKLSTLTDSLSRATQAKAVAENDIGELKYAAELLGTTQEGIAKLVITTLSLLLDPLAVMLILASGVKGKEREVAGATVESANVPLNEPNTGSSWANDFNRKVHTEALTPSHPEQVGWPRDRHRRTGAT